MKIIRAIKLSFIGGASGFLDVVIAYILSLIIQTHSLTLDFIMNGLIFIVVGEGVMLSFIFATAQSKEKKAKLLIGGIIGGFCTGLFFHFGIGQYVGIIIFSALIALIFKMISSPQASKIFLGGCLGGLGSSIFSGIFLISWSRIESTHIFFQNQLSIIPTIVNTVIIVYFMNFGMLIAMKNNTNNRNPSRSGE